MSCHTDDVGGAERFEAVHESYLDFGGHAVGVSCSDALAECLEAAHFCYDATVGVSVESGPSLPERSTIMPGGAQGLVSSPCR